MAYRCVFRATKECDGCGGCDPPKKHYYCPVCGAEIEETVYMDRDGDVVGCEHCVRGCEPEEVEKWQSQI